MRYGSAASGSLSYGLAKQANGVNDLTVFDYSRLRLKLDFEVVRPPTVMIGHMPMRITPNNWYGLRKSVIFIENSWAMKQRFV